MHGVETGRVKLRLAPEELGPVRLELRPGDGAISVHLAAERGETLDLLRRHGEVLIRELRQAGYGEVRLDFGTGWSDGSASRHGYGTAPAPHQSDTATGTTPAETDTPSASETTAPPRRTGARALDMRL